MCDIAGIENMTKEEILIEVSKGGRFIQYLWCASSFINTSTCHSKIFFIKPSQSKTIKGIPYTLISLVYGWWGPMGPIEVFRSLFCNFTGGNDVTEKIVSKLDSITGA